MTSAATASEVGGIKMTGWRDKSVVVIIIIIHHICTVQSIIKI